MRIFLGFISIMLLVSSFIWSYDPNEDKQVVVSIKANKVSQVDSLALDYALKGVKNIQDSLHKKYRYIAIVDFSKASLEKRFYLIDLTDTSIVCTDYVCHGKYSGDNYTNSFSNDVESNKSSLGFYMLAESYMGEHGLSIRMDGLDKGFNDNARKRAIVMHTADYADEQLCRSQGRLGRSLGCPALPSATFTMIAPQITNNALIFHYYPDANYLTSSVWLH